MAELVYVLCALASIVVMAMLLRAYVKNRCALLLWSALCFASWR